jgi:hypothetical protein
MVLGMGAPVRVKSICELRAAYLAAGEFDGLVLSDQRFGRRELHKPAFPFWPRLRALDGPLCEALAE